MANDEVRSCMKDVAEIMQEAEGRFHWKGDSPSSVPAKAWALRGPTCQSLGHPLSCKYSMAEVTRGHMSKGTDIYVSLPSRPQVSTTYK